MGAIICPGCEKTISVPGTKRIKADKKCRDCCRLSDEKKKK